MRFFANIFKFLMEFSICSNQAAASQLQLQLMERNLFRLKAETMPKSPQTAAEVELKFKESHIMDEWGHSQVRFFAI